MGYLIDFSERGGDVQRFDEGLKKAKHGLMEVCDIWESMKQDFSQRGGGSSYGERYTQRSGYNGGGYSQRDYSPSMSERDWAELQERRRRDSMGRFY